MTKTTIYAPHLREELMGYTHAILTKIHKNTNIDFGQLLEIAMPVQRCENRSKEGRKCRNNAITGTCFCKEHSCALDSKLECEYIMINNKEYLYHSLTNRLYSYGADPILIGTLDDSGSICPM